MSTITFVDQQEVSKSVLDDLGHVNNVEYVSWIQEVSKKHWESKVPQSVRKKVLWVVLEHRIQYKSPAFLGDKLEVKTWVISFSGAKSDRCVEIKRQEDQQLIVRAVTTWCLIDRRTRKPKRITGELDGLIAEEQAK